MTQQQSKYRNIKITTKSVVDSKQLYKKKKKESNMESSGNYIPHMQQALHKAMQNLYFISL